MINANDWLEFGQKFHGHKCPAMPMGLRAAAAAMNALGVDRTGDSDLLSLVDLGVDHCATCYADGVQVLTGSTFGKGNIERTNKGKWALTLVDLNTNKAVRVTPTAEMMAANKETPFFKEYREKGVAPTKVPDEVVEPLVEKVMGAPDETLLSISEVYDYEPEHRPHTFRSFVCEVCGEMVAEPYGRVKGDKKVCIDCAAAG
jgi:formylmethanofuran dehydrogenase subunit E